MELKALIARNVRDAGRFCQDREIAPTSIKTIVYTDNIWAVNKLRGLMLHPDEVAWTGLAHGGRFVQKVSDELRIQHAAHANSTETPA